MIRLHGPTYRYSGEILKYPEIIYVEDHHYDEGQQCFHLEKLLQHSTCKDHTIIFDHVVQHDEFIKQNIIYYPIFLFNLVKEFNEQDIQVDWKNKISSFNFMINKPRPHRELLLTVLENCNLKTNTYSLCWETNRYSSLPVTNFILGDEIRCGDSLRNGHYRNAVTYKHLLQRRLFEPSCISLITEPAYYERETILTEKTIMAIWGGTIPIWVGGWKIPEYMQSLGFDIFDDVVDHSYQDLDDPAERCKQAILRNIKILQSLCDVDHGRLKHNFQLASRNPWQNQVNKVKLTFFS